MILGDGSGRARDGLVVSPSEAARLIRDGDTVVVGGSGSLLQVPETLLAAVADRFLAMGHPAGLDVVHVMGLGDQQGRGVDHLARAGLVRRFVGSHFVLSPAEQAMIAEDRVEAVGLPAGTISLLYREIAAGRPGLFTDIGLETYVDPRQQWGRMNKGTREGLSQLVTVGGREWLFYPAFDVQVALIRASTADTSGNLAMEDEAAWSDNLAIAQAAHNTGGRVLAEVKRIVPAGSLPAAYVRVPGVLVDHVVLTDYPNQTPITVHDPARTGMRVNHPVQVQSMTLDHRKVIARRAAMELRAGQLVNLGVGMANGISYVALEEGVLDAITLTVEQGLFGGLPGIGLDSGTAVNPAAVVDMTSQFDLYDGGALDLAGLSFAQIDAAGNVNVARVGATPIGPGGFIDISQKAGTVVFCGTFRGGGLRTAIHDGRLEILEEGRYGKFVPTVDAITYNASRAAAAGHTAVYVTERAVFRLHSADLPPTGTVPADLPPTGTVPADLPPSGSAPDRLTAGNRVGGSAAVAAAGCRLELIEIAPGIDLERDVLAWMPFRPLISPALRTMDPRIFAYEPMGLRLPLSESLPLSEGTPLAESVSLGESATPGVSVSLGESATPGVSVSLGESATPGVSVSLGESATPGVSVSLGESGT
ncbi:CoA-transferase, partial [Actinoplanes sp. NPDC051411]|uniref:acyl CoA:acetate/3-ketoacid CoA transferase n=1 Tax=Actinoplanes sp. NPDC051411 TaxID=3155522 RepID=UPI00343797B8